MDAEARAIRTTCPYCGVGCGVVASTPTVRAAVPIAGDPEHPANFGRLCSKGARSGRDRRPRRPAAPPEIGRRAGVLGRGARPRRAPLPRHDRRARPGRGRLLRLRPVADRGLLRRQQADEGLHRLGQYRHQFAPVHGVRGRRPPPRVRRATWCPAPTRISSLPTWSCWSAPTSPGAIRSSTSASWRAKCRARHQASS